MMELGIFAKTFSGSLPSIFQRVKEWGLNTIQFNFSTVGLASMPDEVDQASKKNILKALEETPLRIEAVSGTFNMIHPNVEMRKTGLRQLAVIAEQCNWLGTNLISLCTGSCDAKNMWKAHADNNSTEAWTGLRKSLDTALEIAEKFNLNLGIEPETANVINSIDKAAKLLKEVNSPRIKIIFDPANIFEAETSAEIKRRIEYGLDVLGEHIVSAHAKDRDAKGHAVPAGKGVLPSTDYLQGLKQIGYKGNLILHGLDASEVEGSLNFIRTQMQALK